MKFATNAETMRAVNEVFSGFVEEAMWRFSEKGLHIGGIEQAHVSMVVVELDKEAFDMYDVPSGQFSTMYDMGVDIDKFKDILEVVRKGSRMYFEHDEDRNRLAISFDNLTRRMSLIDTMGMDDPKVPDFRYDCRFKIKRDELLRVVNAATDVSDCISLTANPDYLFIEAAGVGAGEDNIEAVFTKDMLGLYEVPKDAKAPPKSTFNLENIRHGVYSAPAGAELTVMYSDRYPVRMECQFAYGKGRILHLTAPRFES